MYRTLHSFVGAVATLWVSVAALDAAPLKGYYLEARTCQVYTGPCFANGEIGLCGKDAVMAWNIQSGDLDGVNLAGLHVAVVVQSSHTLACEGLADARTLKSIVVVDDAANSQQRAKLIEFAKQQTGQSDDTVAAVHASEFEMELDLATLTGELTAGEHVHLKTRKARPGDCICSNETAFYPPLAKLEGFVPGVTIDGRVKARELGTRWEIPDTRTAYLGTFSHAQ